MIARTMTVLAAAAVSGLAGEFTPVLDDREIVAQGSCSDFSGYDFNSEDLLPDIPFEEWSISADGSAFAEFSGGTGSSDQSSTIAPTALAAVGTAYADAYIDKETGFALGFAYTRFRIGFSPAEPARARLDADVYAFGPARSWARIYNASGDVLYNAESDGMPVAIDTTLTLPPGAYSFELRADADAYADFGPFSDNADSGYDGSLSMAPGCNAADTAEPYDVLDLADLTAFIGAFTGGHPGADLAQPQGTLDLGDLTAFVGLFLGGCPG